MAQQQVGCPGRAVTDCNLQGSDGGAELAPAFVTSVDVNACWVVAAGGWVDAAGRKYVLLLLSHFRAGHAEVCMLSTHRGAPRAALPACPLPAAANRAAPAPVALANGASRHGCARTRLSTNLRNK